MNNIQKIALAAAVMTSWGARASRMRKAPRNARSRKPSSTGERRSTSSGKAGLQALDPAEFLRAEVGGAHRHPRQRRGGAGRRDVHQDHAGLPRRRRRLRRAERGAVLDAGPRRRRAPSRCSTPTSTNTATGRSCRRSRRPTATTRCWSTARSTASPTTATSSYSTIARTSSAIRPTSRSSRPSIGYDLAPPTTWQQFDEIAQFLTDKYQPEMYGAAFFRQSGLHPVHVPGAVPQRGRQVLRPRHHEGDHQQRHRRQGAHRHARRAQVHAAGRRALRVRREPGGVPVRVSRR